MLNPLLDQALDRTVILGYSRVGYAVRSRAFGPEPQPGALAGRVALVTGASSGLGQATAAGLAELGASVHLLVRDRGRGEKARQAIIDAAVDDPSDRLVLEVCDLSSLAAVREFAAGFVDRIPSLDVVVHNAGVLPPKRTVTDEGNELCLATNVLAPHLLTAMLAPALEAASGRVIWMSSGGMYTQPLRVDDLQFEHGTYKGSTAYARTKRMQVVLAELWADRLDGVAVHSMHPGWADTAGIAASLPRFHRIVGPLLRTPQQGADTAVWLAGAAEPGATTGLFWNDRVPRPTRFPLSPKENDADRAALWDACERLTAAPR
jgi:dehydrogenase/reductase SDR family member 12